MRSFVSVVTYEFLSNSYAAKEWKLKFWIHNYLPEKTDFGISEKVKEIKWSLVFFFWNQVYAAQH